ncbi:MAG TPA: hypothetical protein VF895_03960 [Gaiellaceae bacterium]
MCADFAAPSCADDRIPKIDLRRGELVRFHLGFDPTEVSIAFGKSKPKQLSSSRRPGSRVIHEGVMLLFTHGRGGDASYVACLQFTGAT